MTFTTEEETLLPVLVEAETYTAYSLPAVAVTEHTVENELPGARLEGGAGRQLVVTELPPKYMLMLLNARLPVFCTVIER